MATVGPLIQKIVIANPNGLHLRPATRLAQIARKFRSRIVVVHQGKKADGKSAMELVFLLAMPGAELSIEVEGDDAEEALVTCLSILTDEGSTEDE